MKFKKHYLGSEFMTEGENPEIVAFVEDGFIMITQDETLSRNSAGEIINELHNSPVIHHAPCLTLKQATELFEILPSLMAVLREMEHQ